MATYRCYGRVVGSKYLGTVEASSDEEAIEKAESLESCHIGLCHQCSDNCEDPEVEGIVVEAVDEAADG